VHAVLQLATCMEKVHLQSRQPLFVRWTCCKARVMRRTWRDEGIDVRAPQLQELLGQLALAAVDKAHPSAHRLQWLFVAPKELYYRAAESVRTMHCTLDMPQRLGPQQNTLSITCSLYYLEGLEATSLLLHCIHELKDLPFLSQKRANPFLPDSLFVAVGAPIRPADIR